MSEWNTGSRSVIVQFARSGKLLLPIASVHTSMLGSARVLLADILVYPLNDELHAKGEVLADKQMQLHKKSTNMR